MTKTTNRQLRIEIGRRARDAREEAVDPKFRKASILCQELDVSESMLSQMEKGSRPIPSEILCRISVLTGKPILKILGGGEDSSETTATPFAQAVKFLQQAEQLGVHGLHQDRDAGLYDLVFFIRAMYSGDICITSSSAKGLQQDPNHDFVRTVVDVCRRHPLIEVKTIFTHPMCGHGRELLEGRTRGSIVAEIFQGIRWAIERLGVFPGNIRLIKASPAIFSVFARSGSEGVGLLNPYPHMKQAFHSFAFTLRSVQVQPTTVASGRSKSIYHGMVTSNFDDPFNEKNAKITVDLNTAIDECREEKDDDLLVREASTLESFLKGRERQAPIAKDPAALRDLEGRSKSGQRARTPVDPRTKQSPPGSPDGILRD